MNGVVTWEVMSGSFSTPALWKELPTRKLAANETMDVLTFNIPSQFVLPFMQLGISFKRDVAVSKSLLSLFKTAPFSTEPKLVRVVADYDKALQDIEAMIASAEARAKRPYTGLLPAMLAHNSWL